jgi:hypothetical protein
MFQSSSHRHQGAYVQQVHILICSFDVAQFVEVLCYTPKSRVRLPMVLLKFLSTYSFRPHYGTGLDSASNTNEYQQYFLRGRGDLKAAGA